MHGLFCFTRTQVTNGGVLMVDPKEIIKTMPEPVKMSAEILRLYALGVPVWKIAQRFNVTEHYVISLCRRD